VSKRGRSRKYKRGEKKDQARRIRIVQMVDKKRDENKKDRGREGKTKF